MTEAFMAQAGGGDWPTRLNAGSTERADRDDDTEQGRSHGPSFCLVASPLRTGGFYSYLSRKVISPAVNRARNS